MAGLSLSIEDVACMAPAARARIAAAMRPEEQAALRKILGPAYGAKAATGAPAKPQRAKAAPAHRAEVAHAVARHAVPGVWHLVLPGRPFTTNSVLGAGVHGRNVKAPWRTAARDAATAATLPALTGPVTIDALGVYPGLVAPDPDGLALCVKAAIDGLVEAGVLVDDGPSIVAHVGYDVLQRGGPHALHLRIEQHTAGAILARRHRMWPDLGNSQTS